VSVLVGGSVRVTWIDGADDGESQGDHEGAGGALPLGVALVSATCSSTKSDSPGPLRQGHHRDQPNRGHQIALIEPAGNRVRGVGELHLAGALPQQRNGAFDSTIIAGQEGNLLVTTPPKPPVNRWIQAHSPCLSSRRPWVGVSRSQVQTSSPSSVCALAIAAKRVT